MIEPENELNKIINNSVFTLYKLLNTQFQKIFLNNLVDALTCKFFFCYYIKKFFLIDLCTSNRKISLNANCKDFFFMSEDGDCSNNFSIKTKYFVVKLNAVDEMIRWIL